MCRANDPCYRAPTSASPSPYVPPYHMLLPRSDIHRARASTSPSRKAPRLSPSLQRRRLTLRACPRRSRASPRARPAARPRARLHPPLIRPAAVRPPPSRSSAGRLRSSRSCTASSFCRLVARSLYSTSTTACRRVMEWRFVMRALNASEAFGFNETSKPRSRSSNTATEKCARLSKKAELTTAETRAMHTHL
jgi:hypothetical protein